MGDKTPEKDKSGVDKSSITFKSSSNFKNMKKFFKHIYEREEAKNGHNVNMSMEVEEIERKPVLNHPPLPDLNNGFTTQLITSPKKEIIDPEEDKEEETQTTVIKTEPVEIKLSSEEPKKQTDICRDFLKNNCVRPNCIYRHENDKEARLTAYTFCKDYQNKICKHKNCKFVHASIFEQERYYDTGVLPPEALSHLKNNDTNTSSSYHKAPTVIVEPERPFVVPINIRKTPPPPPPEIGTLPLNPKTVALRNLSMVPPPKQNGHASCCIYESSRTENNAQVDLKLAIRSYRIPRISQRHKLLRYLNRQPDVEPELVFSEPPMVYYNNPPTFQRCPVIVFNYPNTVVANNVLPKTPPSSHLNQATYINAMNVDTQRIMSTFSKIPLMDKNLLSNCLFINLKRRPDKPTIYSDGSIAGPNTFTIGPPKRRKTSNVLISNAAKENPHFSLNSNRLESVIVLNDQIQIVPSYKAPVGQLASTFGLSETGSNGDSGSTVHTEDTSRKVKMEEVCQINNTVIVNNVQVKVNRKRKTAVKKNATTATNDKVTKLTNRNRKVNFNVLLSPRGQVAVAKRTICEQCPLMEERYKQCTSKILSLNKGVEDHIGKISSVDKMHARLYGLQIAMITIMGEGNSGRESPRLSLPVDNGDKMGVDIRSALQVLVNRLSAEELIKSWNGAVRSG